MSEQVPHDIGAATSPEQREQTTHAICAFFESKFIELEVKAKNTSSDYVQQFYELCSGGNRPWTQQKEFELPGLPVPLRVRFDRHSGYIREDRRIDIDITPLIEANDADTLKRAILLILQDIYHEAEHLFTPGYAMTYGSSGMALEDRQQSVEYLCHPGEINAFARQYAFRYAKEFPGSPFTLQKMQGLALHLREEHPRRNDAYNYFIAFTDPRIQKEFVKWGDLAVAQASIVTETANHLKRLSEHS